jgi:hypothetical protein
MKKELMNLFLFIGICFVAYLLFRNFNFSYKEGMTSDPSDNTSSSSSSNGIAGNAAAYGATIKAATIKLQDTFLITKYRSDYENAILNLDDLLNNLMLQTALSADITNPDKAITKLANMNQAKTALNSVMKFVDGK